MEQRRDAECNAISQRKKAGDDSFLKTDSASSLARDCARSQKSFRNGDYS